jgi:hypothetical protein
VAHRVAWPPARLQQHLGGYDHSDKEATVGLLDTLTGQQAWPPPSHAPRLRRQHDLHLLYRNDRAQLTSRFGAELAGYTDPRDAVFYPSVKLAAQALADVLFGEAPTLTSSEVDGDLLDTAFGSVPARLLEGAVTCASQGEVYLRPAWDGELSPWPLLTVVPGRRVLPAFRHGMLAEALVITEHAPDDNTRWRLIEHHAVEGGAGVIRYQAFKGTPDRLGRVEPLPESPWPDPTGTGADTIAPGAPGLLLHHVPWTRDSEDPHGISPFDATEGLVLGLHRLYSQEQHDSEMARRRVAIPTAYLKRDLAGRPTFDRRTDVLELSDEAAGPVGQERPITPLEFSDDLIARERIGGRLTDFLYAVGLAPQSLGKDAGSAESGTARRLAQAHTLRSVRRAGGYFTTALGPCLAQMLDLARTQLGQQVPRGAQVSVALGDGLGADPAEDARVVATLDSAEAISTEQKVRRVNPGWDDTQVADEVAAIEGARPTPIVPPQLSAVPDSQATAG